MSETRKVGLRRFVLLLAAATALAVVQVSPALANHTTWNEWNTGVASAGLGLWTPGAACDDHYQATYAGEGVGYMVAHACYVAYGDYFYVKDMLADGKAAVAYWHSNGRTGGCVNGRGAGTWAVCNKNLTEDRLISIRAGTYNPRTGYRDDTGSAVYTRTS